MQFEEVLPALKAGKKIKRKRMLYGYYYTKNNHILNQDGQIDTSRLGIDILQDDWEIVKAITKKVKIRDLTPEQSEKWKRQYCEKYDCSKDCPFRCVECTDTFWMNCKEMYSDKFLDQEVKIEEYERSAADED